jgi:hypothetical protein
MKSCSLKTVKHIIKVAELKNQIKTYRERLLNSELICSESKDKEAMILKNINSEILRITLIQLLERKMKQWIKTAINQDLKKLIYSIPTSGEKAQNLISKRSLLHAGNDMNIYFKNSENIKIEVSFCSVL